MHFAVTTILFSTLLTSFAAADTCRSGAKGVVVTFDPSTKTCFRSEGVGKPDTLCNKPETACGNSCWNTASNAKICVGPWGSRSLVNGNSRPSPPTDSCAGTTYNDANYHCYENRVACLLPQQLGCGSACYAQFGQVGVPGYCCINNGLVERTNPRCSGVQ